MAEVANSNRPRPHDLAWAWSICSHLHCPSFFQSHKSFSSLLDSAMASDSSPASKVKFVDEGGERPALIKHVPTQKYNRREIQKRLDIESWMEEELKALYDSEEYPQLDIDDVQKIAAGERESRLKSYLAEAKKPVDDFIQALLVKVQEIKPINSS